MGEYVLRPGDKQCTVYAAGDDKPPRGWEQNGFGDGKWQAPAQNVVWSGWHQHLPGPMRAKGVGGGDGVWNGKKKYNFFRIRLDGGNVKGGGTISSDGGGGGGGDISLDGVAKDPAAFVLILSGHHDHPDCNGRYNFDGHENGKPKYAKVTGGSPKLFWTGSSWDCFWGGYSPESGKSTPVPPLDGYDRDRGSTDIRVKYERIGDSGLMPVGVADGRIRDGQMTASSVGWGCKPHYARLHKASGEQWCWCCDDSAKHDLQQWLQVDLGYVASIGGVQTQGGDKDGWEEAPSHFELHLSKDGSQWEPAKGAHKGIDFWHCKTASNVRRVTTHVLDVPISARYVRFVVKGWVGPNPSLRVEILTHDGREKVEEGAREERIADSGSGAKPANLPSEGCPWPESALSVPRQLLAGGWAYYPELGLHNGDAEIKPTSSMSVEESKQFCVSKGYIGFEYGGDGSIYFKNKFTNFGRWPGHDGLYLKWASRGGANAKTTEASGDVVHTRPGERFTWQMSKDYAAEMGGRLLTLEEARAFLAGQPLYSGDDQWCAVGADGNRDWVQVGSRHHHPGKSHNIDCHQYPPWGDDANNQTYGTPSWNYVVLYKKLSEKSKALMRREPTMGEALLGWLSGGGSWHNETVRVEMGADDFIDEVYYNGVDIRSSVSNAGTGANVLKTFNFNPVAGGVLCIAANDNQPGHAASFFLKATSNRPESKWNFTLQPGDARCRAFGTSGISGGGPRHDEHVGSMGRPRQWNPSEGWTANGFDDSEWKAPTRETNYGQHGPQHHWSAHHTKKLGVHLPGVWHDQHKFTFYRICVDERAAVTPSASANPVVMGTIVTDESMPVMPPTVVLEQTSAQPPPLIEMVNAIKKELGIDGTLAQVVAKGCEELGVDTKGKALNQQATECWVILGGSQRSA